MLTNSNKIGQYSQVTTEWPGGVMDIRTHHAAKVDNRIPDTVGVNEAVIENESRLGRWTGQAASLLAEDTTMANMYVSDDGTRLYTVGTTNDRIYQYSLTYPYLTVGGFTPLVNFYAFGTTVVDPVGLYISPDGTKLFVLSATSDTIFSYTFGTAWDVTTLTYDSKSFSVTTQEATPRGLAVKPDGTKFWTVGATNDTIYEYTMSTAWDLSTAAYASVSLSVTALDTAPNSIAWNSTGTRFSFLGATNDQIYEYNAATPWTVAGATAGNQSGAMFGSIPLDNPTLCNGYYFVPGTKYHYVMDTGTDKIYTLWSRATDTISSGVNSNRITHAETFGLGLATPRTIYFRPDGNAFFVVDSTSIVIREYSCSPPWSITSPTLVRTVPIQARIDSALFSSTAARFWLSANGTDLFFVDFSTGNLARYGLINAWNISQMYFKSSAVSAVAVSSNAWCMSRDGLSLYYVSGVTFYRKTMTVPYDITTLSGSATTYSDANYLGGSNTLMAVYISHDGRFLYGLTGASARLYKYYLATPYDITTAAFWSHAYIEDLVPDPNGGLFMSPEGGNIYITDQTNDSLYRYIVNGG